MRGPTLSAFPRWFLAFQRQCPDAVSFPRQRWPKRFLSPVCGGRRGRAGAGNQAMVRGRANCGRPTVHRQANLPRRCGCGWRIGWARPSNGISAVQIRRHLRQGPDKTAWLLCAKLRSAMDDPNRTPPSDRLREMDETPIPLRRHDEPSASLASRHHQRLINCDVLIAPQPKR